MYVVQEFSRFAKQYDSYNMIQKEVAKKLVAMIKRGHYSTIMDIGCGSGVLYQEIDNREIGFDTFWALDFSSEMLSLHPTNHKVCKQIFDFNSKQYFEALPTSSNNLILSSSALQWSKDLDFTLCEISRLGSHFYFSLFTSNTFSTLHQVANISSPIYSKSYILEILNKYYDFKSTEVSYHLRFDDTRQILQYIKRSGVSGGKRQLSYKETKDLILCYPHDYLEFEVLLIEAKLRS